ncbi:hypothetical protein ccrud_00010 [Corynebacterium crudilactis]|uniref:Uncharacterized protein n=1 Tax=Corynebacterium crudilactis TaxID=1652495 RepID=A0A172QQ07_9CORY|nr:hypothetical protein ccrud_00010 [Corynebacterium crudilactis]
MIVDNFSYLWIDFGAPILSPDCADVSPAYPQFLVSYAQGFNVSGVVLFVMKLTELQECNYRVVNKVVDNFLSWSFVDDLNKNRWIGLELQKRDLYPKIWVPKQLL